MILQGYRTWGIDVLTRLRGMFAFGLWDEEEDLLLLARDPFGIKPMYWTVVGDVLYFASEIKALLPFLPSVETNLEAFQDYLTFQFCLGGKTLFEGVNELLPGHFLRVRNGSIETHRYWEVYYDADFEHTAGYFEEQIRSLVAESVELHLRSDVPVGAYVSGGFDSSLVATLAARMHPHELLGFTGKFSDGLRLRREWVRPRRCSALGVRAARDRHPRRRLRSGTRARHLPPRLSGRRARIVSRSTWSRRLAARERKVLLGGQGGDEMFGGYARYLIAYFEQCIKAAIEGTMPTGNFIVTYESIIPNLSACVSYKPLIQDSGAKGCSAISTSGTSASINRAPDLGRRGRLGRCSTTTRRSRRSRAIFRRRQRRQGVLLRLDDAFRLQDAPAGSAAGRGSLSAWRTGSSRVSPCSITRSSSSRPRCRPTSSSRTATMKHGFASRLRRRAAAVDPASRQDKMGFPVPLQEWVAKAGAVREFVLDVLSSDAARDRALIDNRKVLAGLEGEHRYGRRLWGFLSLELWQRQFHDEREQVPETAAGQGDSAGMKVLITGGAGFIGSTLADRLLARGDEIVVDRQLRDRPS